jgi:hypothetical protein
VDNIPDHPVGEWVFTLIGFEILMAMTMRRTTIWDMPPCRNVSKLRLLLAGYLLGLLFDPEDGCGTSL